MSTSGLPAVLHQTLTAFASRRQRILVLRGMGETVLVQLIGLAGVAAIDATVHPGRAAHWALSLAAYGAAGTVLALRVIHPLMHQARLVDSALDIERRVAGRLQERLSSAVQLARQPAAGVSAWMIERTIALAGQEAAQLDIPSLYPARPGYIAWLRAGVFSALVAGSCLVPSVLVYLERAAWPVVLRPPGITLEVLPGDTSVTSGSALEMHVRATPDPGVVSIAVAWADGINESRELQRDKESGHYTLRLPVVTCPLTYRVQAGGGESPVYHVAVARPAALEKLTLHITPPAYTSLPERTIDGGDAEVLSGSTVVVQAQLSGAPTLAGSLTYDGSEHAATIAGSQLHASLVPAATVSYGLRLVGAGGLVFEPAQRWLLTLLPDKPPQVSLSGHGLESGMIASDEAVVVDIQASDDIGLRALEVVVQVDGSERRRLPLAIPPAGRRSTALAVGIDLPGLAAQVGQVITLVARATDVGGQITLSKPLSLTVVPGADARSGELALRLRTVLKRIEAQSEVLHAMARQWTNLSHPDQAEDHAIFIGDLKLIADRIDLWSGDLGGASQQLCDEGNADRVPFAAVLLSLGEELAAWTRGEGHQLGLVCAEGQSSTGSSAAAVRRGRELCEAAISDLSSFHHDLALIIAHFEASSLAGSAEAALARMQRALPVARGERGWHKDGQQSEPGLLGIFYGGVTLSGDERYREVAVPNWRNRDVPAIGRNDFSVRYSGEVLIPKTGDWTFVAGGDDGVRLFVEGKSLLPADSWRSQAFSNYHGHLHLSAGWHPVVIEMYQGVGESGLELSLGPTLHEAKPVTKDNLRTILGDGGPALVQAMADLPRDQSAAADQRISEALAFIANVPKTIGSINIIAANDELTKMDNQLATPASILATDAGALQQADLSMLSSSEQASKELVSDARRASDILNDQAGRELHGRVAAGDLSALRQALARVRDRTRDLQRISERLSAQDRELRLHQEFVAGRAWFAEFAREAVVARRLLLDEARLPTAQMGRRDVALLGARRMARVIPTVNTALAALATIPDSPQQAESRLREQADLLERVLAEGENYERSLRRERSAELAQDGLVLFPQRDGNQAAEVTLSAQNHQRLSSVVEGLCRLQRRGGDAVQADALERLLGPNLSSAQLLQIAQRLAESARDTQVWYGDLDRETADQLAASAQDLGKAQNNAQEQVVDQNAATRVDLDEARLALALEGEHHHGQQPAALASAFILLANDITAVVAAPPDPSVDQVTAFAQRAAALANMRSPQERDAALAAAAAHPPAAVATDAATALQALAEKVQQAADHSEQRAAVEDALTVLAAQALARDAAVARQERVGLAQHLQELSARDAQHQSDEAAMRHAFAEAERHLAESTPAIAEQVAGAQALAQAQTANHPDDHSLGLALEQAHQELPQASQSARDLAAQADQQSPTPQAQNGPTSAHLVQQARALAEQIDAKAAAPIAGQYQHQEGQPASVDDPARQSAADAGRAVANLVAEQRTAADNLAAALSAREQDRTELAHDLESVAALQTSAPPDTPAALQAAEQAAAQAQRTADEQQRHADEAQAAAVTAEAIAQERQFVDDRPQAQQSNAQAAAAENQAIEAQTRALDAQLAALAQENELAAKLPGDARVAAEQAKAAANLGAAQDESLKALALANQQRQQPAVNQAQANVARADTALQALATRVQQDALAVSQSLTAPAIPATAPDGAALVPSIEPPASLAGAFALAQIHGGSDAGTAFRRAAATLRHAAQQARLTQDIASRPSQAQSQNPNPNPNPSQAQTESSNSGEHDQVATADPKVNAGSHPVPPGVDQAEWAKSQAALQQNVRSAGVEQFSEEYQEAIRAYLKRLGDGQ